MVKPKNDMSGGAVATAYTMTRIHNENNILLATTVGSLMFEEAGATTHAQRPRAHGTHVALFEMGMQVLR